MKPIVLLFATAVVALPLAEAGATNVAVQLRGSRASMKRQHEVAEDLDLTFLRTPAQVREFVKKERLERVPGNTNYTMAKVSFPYARPAVKTFIERLAARYRAFSGEKLVVTSLTRPTSRQPRNASPLSVHPAGIAVDFRIPDRPRDRKWLENTLLSLESSGVLDATREHRPPHYHVAVFPEKYEEYLAGSEGRKATAAEDDETDRVPLAANVMAATPANPAGRDVSLPALVVAIASLGALGGALVRRRLKRG